MSSRERQQINSIPSIDIETGKLRIGFKTFVSIIVAIIAAVVAVVTFGVNLATSADVDKALTKHSQSPHMDGGKLVSAPASIIPKVEENKSEIKALKTEQESISKKIDQINTNQSYMRARIDFMIERELIETRGDPTARSATKRAARKVRERAAKSNVKGDPLSGIEGL